MYLRCFPSLIRIIESFWQREALLVIFTKILGIRVPFSMGSFVPKDQTRRLFIIHRFQPTKRLVGNAIGNITLLSDQLAVLVFKFRIEVMALTYQHIEVIKAF